MLTAYSRVTVVSGTRKVDLALPSALPVADVVPQVLRYCTAPDEGGEPSRWTLVRLGGSPLALTQTLAEAGVLDGEVLELRGEGRAVRPAMVEDVRDALEDAVDSGGAWWSTRTTVTFSLLAAVSALTAAGLVQLLSPATLGGDATSRLVGALAALTALLGLTAWSVRMAPSWVSGLCATAAVGWAFVLGAALGEFAELEPALVAVVAGAFAVLTAGAAGALTDRATALLAAVLVLGAYELALGIAGLADLAAVQVSRVAPVLAVLVTGVLPRLTLAVGGLASADYRIRHVGRLSDSALLARYRRSNGLLVGGLTGLALVVAWAGTVLTFSGDQWDRYLALSVAVALVLRSRVYSRVPHMVALRVAGAYLAGLQLVRLGVDEPGLTPWLVVVLAGVGLLGVAVASLALTEVTRARLKRVLNVVEFLVVVDMVVLMIGALGTFAWIGDRL